MSANQENVSKILSVLSHKIRRQILLTLCDNGENSFTELMNTLKIDTGKLSFHMRSLSTFIEQTDSGKYRLSRAGEDAVRVIRDVESWAEVADVDRKASQLPLAKVWKRSLAFLVDFFIVFALTSLLMLQAVFSIATENWLIVGVNLLFVALAFLWVYSTLLEGFRGQTIGKRVFGLTVVQTDSRKLTYEHAAVRNFGKVLLPFDLLFGYEINDARFLRYFDKFAGTTVIDLRKRKVEPPKQVEEAEPEEPVDSED
ncbi:MAG: RDD family protein [Candidatus Bathyarchaeota archaeon]|nr:RDD family protein [Candidatus Bathyarchaeota archaeon]